MANNSRLNTKKLETRIIKNLKKNLEEFSDYIKSKNKFNEIHPQIKKIIQTIKQKEKIEIPLEIFATKLSPAEAICKYLKENKNLKFSQIAKLINRDQKTVRTNYVNSIKKSKEKLKTKKPGSIPLAKFSNNRLSIFESVVKHLKDKKLSNSEIGNLLNKKPNNIWTINQRLTKK